MTALSDIPNEEVVGKVVFNHDKTKKGVVESIDWNHRDAPTVNIRWDSGSVSMQPKSWLTNLEIV